MSTKSSPKSDETVEFVTHLLQDAMFISKGEVCLRAVEFTDNVEVDHYFAFSQGRVRSQLGTGGTLQSDDSRSALETAIGEDSIHLEVVPRDETPFW